MNPIARFVGQAEAEIGGATRRIVDSVTTPVRAKGQEMAAEASAAVSRLVRIVVLKGAFGIVAAAMAITALVYLAAAVHQALLPHLGPIETRLAMALIFLVIAVVAGLCMAFWPTGTASETGSKIASQTRDAMDQAGAKAKEAASTVRAKAAEMGADAKEAASDAKEAASDAKARATGPSATDTLRSGVEQLAGVLGAAGFRREQAGLRAGMMLANQLKPMQLVSLALIGGFLAGMRRR